MAIHKSLSELQLAAMDETLNAAELLLADESKNKALFLKGSSAINDCRYGYPAAVLLFSFIDAVGTVYTDEKYKVAFRVLNDKIFGKQNLTTKACDNLYDKYRSALTHNMTLPANTFLTYDSSAAEAFIIKGDKNEVNEVNLYQLLRICKEAFSHLKEGHEGKFKLSKIMKDISKKNLNATDIPNLSKSPSGVRQ